MREINKRMIIAGLIAIGVGLGDYCSNDPDVWELA